MTFSSVYSGEIVCSAIDISAPWFTQGGGRGSNALVQLRLCHIEPPADWWRAALVLNEFAPSQSWVASIYELTSLQQFFNEPLSYSIIVSCKGHLISGRHQVHPITSIGKTSSQLNYQLTPVGPQSALLAALRPAVQAQSGRMKGASMFTDSHTITIKGQLMTDDSTKEEWPVWLHVQRGQETRCGMFTHRVKRLTSVCICHSLQFLLDVMISFCL